MNTIKILISTIHTQQLTDINGAIRAHLKELNNPTWKEIARASIGEAMLGARSSFEERYKAGMSENLNQWLDATSREIQKRTA